MPTTINEKDQWGYPFGIDGVIQLRKACEQLAISRDTIYEYARAGQLRIKNHRNGKQKRGRAVVCKRSIRRYLDSL